MALKSFILSLMISGCITTVVAMEKTHQPVPVEQPAVRKLTSPQALI